MCDLFLFDINKSNFRAKNRKFSTKIRPVFGRKMRCFSCRPVILYYPHEQAGIHCQNDSKLHMPDVPYLQRKKEICRFCLLAILLSDIIQGFVLVNSITNYT